MATKKPEGDTAPAEKKKPTSASLQAAIAQLEEAVDLLKSVVRELKSLQGRED